MIALIQSENMTLDTTHTRDLEHLIMYSPRNQASMACISAPQDLISHTSESRGFQLLLSQGGWERA